MWNGQNGVFRTHASLDIRGTGLSPEEVTNLLGLEPTRASTKGDCGAWTYSTRDAVDNLASLETHINHLLDLLPSRKKALRQVQERLSARIFCYFASQSDLGGFVVTSKTLKRLGELGLDLDVDEYFCCGDCTNEDAQPSRLLSSFLGNR